MLREPTKTSVKFRLPSDLEGEENGIAIYEVEIVTTEASWSDTLASREHLASYLRGAEALFNMCFGPGEFPTIEIPG